MANNLTSNPIYIDTAATIWVSNYKASGDIVGTKNVLLMQWVDDNADIATAETLDMTINGIQVIGKTNFHDTAGSVDLPDVVRWQIGPFANGFPVTSLVVTTISHGVLYIWLE